MAYFPRSPKGILKCDPIIAFTALVAGFEISLEPYIKPGRKTTPVVGYASSRACSVLRFPL